MSDNKTTRTEKHQLRNVQQAFPFIDRMGRRIGASATISRETWVNLPADHKGSYSTQPAGDAFKVDVTSTRNGEGYGASFNGQRFTTLVEAEAYLAKYMKDAAKRAGKIKGAVPAAL